MGLKAHLRTGSGPVAFRQRPAYLSNHLAGFLNRKDMKHVRGAPYHPMTQGKIERWHRSLKNVVLLNHYFTPSQLDRETDDFVQFYNFRRYHEFLNNPTPADVYFGRDKEVLTRRDRIKQETMKMRRQLHYRSAHT